MSNTRLTRNITGAKKRMTIEMEARSSQGEGSEMEMETMLPVTAARNTDRA